MSTSTGVPSPSPPARRRPGGTMSAGRKIAGAAAALVVTTAAVIGLAAPAQAAEAGVLTIADYRIEETVGDNCRVITNGYIPLGSQATAQFIIDNGAQIYVTLYGDDSVYDDYLGGGYRAQLFVTPDGDIFYHSNVTALTCSRLDEDHSFYDDRDEVYARVDYYPGPGSRQTKNSKVWRDYF